MIKGPLTHLAIAAGIFILALGSYIAWYTYVGNTESKAGLLFSEIERVRVESIRSLELESVLASIAEDETAINSRFIVVKDIALFLEELEATGRGLGASIEVVSVADKPTPEGRILITLRMTGSYASILRTIGAIEYGPRDTRLENLSLSATEAVDSWVATAGFTVGVPAPAATSTPKK